MTGTKALRMTRGKGLESVTHYSCGTVEKAKANKAKLLVTKVTDGKLVERAIKPRIVHRINLFAKFGDTHRLAGEGKYIGNDAIPSSDPHHKNSNVLPERVVGAQHVNPYLRDEGAYAGIIETLLKDIGSKALASLKARVKKNFDSGEHLTWEGKRADFDGVAASTWMTKEEIMEKALSLNPDLAKALRKSKSGRKGATHKSAAEKFFGDLDVLRRATCVVNVATGEREFCGGATPYSKPLEQVGFAIDKQFLTHKVNANNEHEGEYYYRLVIGRSEPHILRHRDWAREDNTSSIVFKDDTLRRKAKSRAA
jgi:hypothetical protein